MKTEISKIRRNIMGTISFTMKIKGMRKEQEFIIYPITGDSKELLIQSKTRIARLNSQTGQGVISESHQGGAYGPHLAIDKLTPFTVEEIDMQALRMQIFTTASKHAGNNGVIYTDNSGAVNILDV
jgi:hypothetical protein